MAFEFFGWGPSVASFFDFIESNMGKGRFYHSSAVPGVNKVANLGSASGRMSSLYFVFRVAQVGRTLRV